MYIYIYIHMYLSICMYLYKFIGKQRVLRRGCICTMTPSPKLGDFGSFLRGGPEFCLQQKLFYHGFEQSCSAMVTQKLEEKVQQHDEDAESSKTGCSSPSRAHGKACKQVPALICDSYACRILCASAIFGGYFAHMERNSPINYLGNKSEIAHLNFIISPPPLNRFCLQHQVRKPPLPNPSFPCEYICMYLKWTFLKWPF